MTDEELDREALLRMFPDWDDPEIDDPETGGDVVRMTVLAIGSQNFGIDEIRGSDRYWATASGEFDYDQGGVPQPAFE